MPFWNWFVRNISHIFGIIGIALTIYFGVFYAPSWLEEVQNEKIKNIESEIQSSIKEIVYNDSIINISQINSLLKAKELSMKGKLKLDTSEVLIKTQESFMEDKFIPLNKRLELLDRIEQVKLSLNKNISNKHTKELLESYNDIKNDISYGALLIAISSVLLGVLGVLGSFFKFQSDKEKTEEINNEVQEDLKSTQIYAYEFESKIKSIIKKHIGVPKLNNLENDDDIDIVFEYQQKRYFVEIKYLQRSKVGLVTAHRLINYLRDKEGEAWLIYNTELTSMVSRVIKDYNKNSHSKIKLIKFSNPIEFEKEILRRLQNN